MTQQALGVPQLETRFLDARTRIAALVLDYRPFITLGAVLVLLLLLGYWLPWTGFGSRPNAQGDIEPARTLWDWLQLLLLPAVIAWGAFAFLRESRKVAAESDQRRDETAVKLATADLGERGLRNCLDQLTGLILEKNLRGSKPDDQVRAVARARTLAALRTLNHKHNRVLLQFLRDSGLIVTQDVITFREADLSDADLVGADLRGLDLTGANLGGADLHGANLMQVNLSTANLHMANLAGANLNYANLNRADLRAANLSRAQLFRAILHNARLELADLSGANLAMAQLKVAELGRANLSGATLSDADLTHAHLFNADLSGANLTDARLPNAHLTNADLSRAVLTGAQVLDQQLARVRSLAGATMPDGTIRPAAATRVV